VSGPTPSGRGGPTPSGHGGPTPSGHGGPTPSGREREERRGLGVRRGGRAAHVWVRERATRMQNDGHGGPTPSGSDFANGADEIRAHRVAVRRIGHRNELTALGVEGLDAAVFE